IPKHILFLPMISSSSEHGTSSSCSSPLCFLDASRHLQIMKLGAHMSTGGGVWKALERGQSIGCEAVQIFVKSNMRWMGSAHSPKDISLFGDGCKAGKFACVFGHTGYLINLGSPPGPNRDNSIKSLIQEIEFATALDLPFLVMHPGAHLGHGEEKAI